MTEPRPLRQPLSQEEFEAIFSRVPRLTVEVVIAEEHLGVLLAMRDIPPCQGLWHIPGGTVRFGEPVTEAVRRVAHDELDLDVDPLELLGYIEYPSHYENGLDSPVGLAFRARQIHGDAPHPELPDGCGWFETLPKDMHEEQRDFLLAHLTFLRTRSPEA